VTVMEVSSGFLSKSKHAENEENDDDESDEIDDAMHGEPRDLPSVSLALAQNNAGGGGPVPNECQNRSCRKLRVCRNGTSFNLVACAVAEIGRSAACDAQKWPA
jgi:hypothetical protein